MERVRGPLVQRKIAIGDCMRAYGTNCVHEYACEQCKNSPDQTPAPNPVLERTRDGLLKQSDEARERGWRGQVERLNYILGGIQDKLDEIERSGRRTTIVQLGPPRTRPSPQNSAETGAMSVVTDSGPRHES